jgi:hypothetical protein
MEFEAIVCVIKNSCFFKYMSKIMFITKSTFNSSIVFSCLKKAYKYSYFNSSIKKIKLGLKKSKKIDCFYTTEDDIQLATTWNPFKQIMLFKNQKLKWLKNSYFFEVALLWLESEENEQK